MNYKRIKKIIKISKSIGKGLELYNILYYYKLPNTSALHNDPIDKGGTWVTEIDPCTYFECAEHLERLSKEFILGTDNESKIIRKNNLEIVIAHPEIYTDYNKIPGGISVYKAIPVGKDVSEKDFEHIKTPELDAWAEKSNSDFD